MVPQSSTIGGSVPSGLAIRSVLRTAPYRAPPPGTLREGGKGKRIKNLKGRVLLYRC
jgi:hypothetical protein